MSPTHLLLIPSYDTGPQLYRTIGAARAVWSPVWVVIDGSTDGTAEGALRMAENDPGLTVMVLEENRGKGAAIFKGISAARAAGFSHVLTMDSDGQHPVDLVRTFMAASTEHPAAMILGRPVFDASAPSIRVRGRRISNWLINLETLGAGIDDALYGFRVYPIAPLLEVMTRRRWMRRFDFDTEVVVRLAWRGVEAINLPAPVRYLAQSEGGVSHFRYGRDNCLLTWVHLRLLTELAGRLPALVRRRLAARRSAHHQDGVPLGG